MPKITITYDIVTYESAAHGDFAEIGFISPNGYQCEISTVDFERDMPDLQWDLRSAVREIGYVENSGSWFTECDGRHDYQTGAETRYSLHPPKNITGSSYRRLARLLKTI